MSELALKLIAENKKTRNPFLDLGNCGLTEVPEEIGELVWLEGLLLARAWTVNDNKTLISNNSGPDNNIVRLAPVTYCQSNPESSPFSRLVNLRWLCLSDRFFEPMAFSDLSPLSSLKTLRTLYIPNTPVTDLTPLSGFKNLLWLDISNTQVTDLTPLADSKNLQMIFASNTQVTDLTPLSDFVNLERLEVSNTPVNDVRPLSGLANLYALDITETQVNDLSPLERLISKGLPVEMHPELWWTQGIFVSNCPMTNPPMAIVNQGNAAILRYFAEQRRAGTIKVREAKLLIVGQGKAGKTTLRRKLENPYAPMPEPGDTTRGIEITRLDEKMPQTGEPLRINVWDFGGQDIQHFAHQFFLTGNSLYALVTNERIQDSVHLSYWLNIIEMLGKKSPVILIQNMDGGNCQPLREEAAIRERFGNVNNRVFRTDLSQAATELEFAELRQEIVHQASHLLHIEHYYLVSFTELRVKLEAEVDLGTHYLRWEDYLSLMPELSEDLMRDYANTLTYFGICQYYSDDAMLSGFVFLRPKWIIDALFALLLHPWIEDKRGKFAEKDTLGIWDGEEYRGMHGLLVRMMEEFELCYRIEGGGHMYILPQRLPSESRTYGWNEPDATPVQYKYKFMPKGILTRLICRLHARIEADPELGQRVWCDAVIFMLPDGKGRVFAREVYSENTIELRAIGDKRAEMLNEVIRNMDDINRDAKYDNLQVEKLVPCPCEECVRAEIPYFHEYETLQKRIEKHKPTSQCDKSGEDVPIDEIFYKSGVQKPETHQIGLRIFISYSHAQRDYFPIFKEDFRQYAKLPGLDIEIFDDYEIPSGADWDKFLQDKVANCNVMVLLVSQEFMNSKYIQEKEFGAAIRQLKAGRRLLIVPVYFAPCLFTTDEELAHLQFFKPHGDRFDEAKKGDGFAYIDLVKFNQKDGEPIPNANRKHYMLELVKKLEPDLRGLVNNNYSL
ncbi:COR domain-containing protein [Methylosarcina fibrata]|uniref:COR domain-containing protein n=1 Tax=Methylosarcina fibrata TaxID=105972 RepID=UPI0003A0D0F2|nr:COR domain-containing protein [Methylosarcina fibrata]